MQPWRTVWITCKRALNGGSKTQHVEKDGPNIGQYAEKHNDQRQFGCCFAEISHVLPMAHQAIK